MASVEHTTHNATTEQLELGSRATPLMGAALAIGAIGLVGAVVAGYSADHTLRRFLFAYMVSFAFFVSLCLGALFFVLVHHLTRACWNVAARRIGEMICAATPVMLLLALPIFASVAMNKGNIYRWSEPATEQVSHEGHEQAAAAVIEKSETASVAEKSVTVEDGEVAPEVRKYFLNPPVFIVQIAAYLAIWSLIGVWYWKQSVRQDKTGDTELTRKMQARSAPALVVIGGTMTLMAYAMLMSLLPGWSSTMFGVYFFAGSALGIFATMIIIALLLQRMGYLRSSITVEHYHDLGKYLFTFTFFWGYIAFSQFMLLWYANIPEETKWFFKRGASTMDGSASPWSIIALVVLFGHLLVPFAGLLSRHIKRRRQLLLFWAVWLLAFHWLDLYWVIMPEYDGNVHFGLIDVGCFLGIGGFFVAALVKIASMAPLRPMQDPRLEESLSFHNAY